MQWTLSELIERFDGLLLNSNKDVTLSRLVTLEKGVSEGLSFCENPKYFSALYQTKASAVLVSKYFKPVTPVAASLIGVAHPYAVFCTLLKEVRAQKYHTKSGIEFPSYVGHNLTVGENIYRGAFSYIGHHVVIGKNVKIYPHVYVGDYVTIGNDTILYSGSKIASYTTIGNRCVVHYGAVIGSLGFGFLNDENGYKRIPSIGNVQLEDDVEIGTNTTIDAATIDSTIIHQGTKIDNLVQVGHNVQIGKHTAIAAQVGIAGSTKIGSYGRLGGQTGVAGHLHLGDRITSVGRAGITRSFPKGNITLSGTPAFENKKFLACYARFKHLGEIKTCI